MKIMLSKRDIQENVEMIHRLVDVIDPLIGGNGEKPDDQEMTETLLALGNNCVKVRPTFFGGVVLEIDPEYLKEFNDVAMDTILACIPHMIGMYKSIMEKQSAWKTFMEKWFRTGEQE